MKYTYERWAGGERLKMKPDFRTPKVSEDYRYRHHWSVNIDGTYYSWYKHASCLAPPRIR